MITLDNANVRANINANVGTLAIDSAILSSQLCEANSHMAMPELPNGGAIVKICYAGLSLPEGALTKRNRKPKLPGNEIAGIIHDISNEIPNCNYTIGEKVIVLIEEDQVNTGYAEFLAVKNPDNLVQLPNNMDLEAAAMLPGAAMSAYMAILRAKPHVEYLQTLKPCVNVMIVGAGSRCLWTLKLAEKLMQASRGHVKIYVVDNSIEKLLTAESHGCTEIINWDEQDYEQGIYENTMSAISDGVDIAIDFVGTKRTIQRCLKVLNREGLILVAGDSASEVSINLSQLASKHQSILGINRGNATNLQTLVNLITDNSITAPQFTVHPVEDINSVWRQACDCDITGSAIIKYSHVNNSA